MASNMIDPFANSPCAFIAQAFAELYPDKRYIAVIVEDLRDEDGDQSAGIVTLPEDPETLPVVELSGQIRVVDMGEVFASSLAKVAAGDGPDAPPLDDIVAKIKQRFDEILSAAMENPEEVQHGNV